MFSDLDLGQRLERTEAHAGARFVEARAKVFPQSGARWIEVAGTYAMYDGAISAATQTFGLGLSETKDVALLAGACTITEGRNQGAQLALLDCRLRYAASHGCSLAMMCAEPGGRSQRNAERNGFRIAYTRIKWRLSKETE